MIITVDQIMSYEPCYERDEVERLICNGKTPEEILDLDIPIRDKFWLLLRPDFLPVRTLHLLACAFAQMVAHLNTDPRIKAAIDAERAWLEGKLSDEELYKVEAAFDVAPHTTGAIRAAYAAYAVDAAYDAAYSAIYDPADEAAYAAAYSARNTNLPDIPSRQITLVKSVFKELSCEKSENK